MWNMGPLFRPVQSILYILLSFVLPFGLLFLLGRMLMKNIGNSGAMKFGKSNAKMYVKADKGKLLMMLQAQDEAKDSLTEIVDFLSRPQKYTEINCCLSQGVLLIGPPGTGKTPISPSSRRSRCSFSSLYFRFRNSWNSLSV